MAQDWSVVAALPLVIPSYVIAMALRSAFGPRGLLADLTGIGFPIVNGFTGAWLALTIATYPFVYLVAAASMRRMGRSQEEAARGPRGRAVAGVPHRGAAPTATLGGGRRAAGRPLHPVRLRGRVPDAFRRVHPGGLRPVRRAPGPHHGIGARRDPGGPGRRCAAPGAAVAWQGGLSHALRPRHPPLRWR